MVVVVGGKISSIVEKMGNISPHFRHRRCRLENLAIFEKFLLENAIKRKNSGTLGLEFFWCFFRKILC